MTKPSAQVHASAVAVRGKGCLITGTSGSGKSTLCFEMIALGAALVADDRVDLSVSNGALMLTCPPPIAGRIEARGIGLVELPGTAKPVPCVLIVDLDHVAERLPVLQQRDLLGIRCPVIFGAKRPGLASILSVLLGQGKLLDADESIKP